MSVRTEQTLRRMWTEAADNQTDATKLMDACKGHASAADDAGRAARAHQNEAAKAKLAADEFAAQAADLVDMVNEKRAAMGLAPLAPGDPYPVDPSPTDTDGLDTRGVEQP